MGLGIGKKAVAMGLTGTLVLAVTPAVALGVESEAGPSQAQASSANAQNPAPRSQQALGTRTAQDASQATEKTSEASSSTAESNRTNSGTAKASTAKSKTKKPRKAAKNAGKAKSKFAQHKAKASGKAKKKKAKATRKKKRKVTRTYLLKNLGKTAKRSTAFKTTGTTYKLGKTKAGRKLMRQIKALRKHHRVSFALIDLKTGATISSQSGRMVYSASCLKGPYVAAINKYKRAGTGPHTRWLMKQTIVYSNNDTYSTLRRRYGAGPMRAYAKYAHTSKSFSPSRYYAYVKPADLAKLWVANYWYFFKDTNKRSKYVRNLYTHGYMSYLYQTFRGKKRVYAKPGWFPGSFGNVYNDAGIITCKVKVKTKHGTKYVNRPYVLCVMSGAWGHPKQLRGIVRQADKVHTQMIKHDLR